MFKCNECGWVSSHSEKCLNCGNTKNDIKVFSFEELFLQKLKDLCQEYDYIYGEIPSSFYEGKSIYDFYICDYVDKAQKETIPEWIKEAYDKFAKEKEES